MCNPVRREAGFTLLEILAAVLIVLILAAMIFPAVQGILPRVEKIRCMNNLRNLRVAFSG
jgi:prepilin-type N-terminal cleavage/methylation domain-containing protein